MTLHRILSWTPAAVVFDCDGTLMDTERHWVDARQRAFDEVGLSPSAGFAERAKGLHYTECGQLMADEGGRPDLGRDLAERLLRHFLALVSDSPVTMPGAREMVEAAAAFAPLAVASNCPRDVVETCLDNAGLLRHFRAVVVPDDDAVRPKPAPDVYLTAARHCGADPADALAVEDTHCGILAAVRAGLRVLGVGPWPGDETAALVDLWVETLDDPRVGGWATERAPLRATAPLPAAASRPAGAVFPAAAH
ncbi:HAD family phosphatase [Streptomyces sp. LP05-1]|uniref:HAD family phosphatase n=1 Tax=Streptomyces pyxinae TaxID=2970734 RepID=A0ABT2CHA3_9ACTN|nr:HAD family phosphatase [Streptomyces sp. LP05-1]MCS0636791.1 HAD family phosphatase [Streptomyces sp. LP05-1]